MFQLGVSNEEMDFIRLLKRIYDEVNLYCDECVDDGKNVVLKGLEEEDEGGSEGSESEIEDTDDVSSSSEKVDSIANFQHLPKLQQIENDLLSFGFDFAYQELATLITFLKHVVSSDIRTAGTKKSGPDNCKASMLIRYLKEFFNNNNNSKVVVFVKTRRTATKLKEILSAALGDIQVSITTGNCFLFLTGSQEEVLKIKME